MHAHTAGHRCADRAERRLRRRERWAERRAGGCGRGRQDFVDGPDVAGAGLDDRAAGGLAAAVAALASRIEVLERIITSEARREAELAREIEALRSREDR